MPRTMHSKGAASRVWVRKTCFCPIGNLGSAYKDLAEPRKAIAFYEQALIIRREIGNRRGEGSILGNFGIAYAGLGEPRKAIRFHEDDLAIAREIGDRRGEGKALGNADLLEDKGNPTEQDCFDHILVKDVLQRDIEPLLTVRWAGPRTHR